jgi:protoporphyrinogen oxidase
MFPFRELELYDDFVFEGNTCEKIGNSKYIVYDNDLEPVELLTMGNVNSMVEPLSDGDEYFGSLVAEITRRANEEGISEEDLEDWIRENYPEL